MRVTALDLVFGILILSAAHSSSQTATVYTDQTVFLNSVQPGFYLETFDALPQNTVLAPPLSFSTSGFSYTATTPDLFLTLGGTLTTLGKVFDITFTFTSDNVTALGGNFFLGTNGLPPSGPVLLSLALNDGTNVSLMDPTGSTFVGFTTNIPIQTLVLSTVTDNRFVTVDNLISGASVPEPAEVWLLGAGLIMLTCAQRVAQRSAAENYYSRSNA